MSLLMDEAVCFLKFSTRVRKVNERY